MLGEAGTQSWAGSLAAGCSWQVVRLGRSSSGKGRLLVDTAAVPELSEASAARPESSGPVLDQRQVPGMTEVRSSETAAAAAEAVVGLAAGHQADDCSQLREKKKASS